MKNRTEKKSFFFFKGDTRCAMNHIDFEREKLVRVRFERLISRRFSYIDIEKDEGIERDNSTRTSVYSPEWSARAS